jgi:hypothetical protein
MPYLQTVSSYPDLVLQMASAPADVPLILAAGRVEHVLDTHYHKGKPWLVEECVSLEARKYRPLWRANITDVFINSYVKLWHFSIFDGAIPLYEDHKEAYCFKPLDRFMQLLKSHRETMAKAAPQRPIRTAEPAIGQTFQLSLF